MARLHECLLIVTTLVVAARAASPQAVRCSSPSAAPARIEKVINECQDEIKKIILLEARSVLEGSSEGISRDFINPTRTKRQAFSDEERRIAGECAKLCKLQQMTEDFRSNCLLQCVYRKVNVLDQFGVPTGEGLVKLYVEGVQDPGYFLATAQGVNKCMGAAKQKGLLVPPSGKDKIKMCYLAYDLFECVSDHILEYCGALP